jgi:hypothetical protein
MKRPDLRRLGIPDLFLLWSDTLAELRQRGAVRSGNNPVAGALWLRFDAVVVCCVV